MTTSAKGAFDVKTTPLAWNQSPLESVAEAASDASLGRYLLDKHYHGDLEAAGEGQMLTAGSPKAGSAAYVAIEKVSGTLGGRAGSFVLTHVGTMHAGAFQLQVAIAPGSGTGALQGIAGVLEIQNAAGDHTYELVYTLPESE